MPKVESKFLRDTLSSDWCKIFDKNIFIVTEFHFKVAWNFDFPPLIYLGFTELYTFHPRNLSSWDTPLIHNFNFNFHNKLCLWHTFQKGNKLILNLKPFGIQMTTREGCVTLILHFKWFLDKWIWFLGKNNFGPFWTNFSSWSMDH